MKILVSSKDFYNSLKRIDIDTIGSIELLPNKYLTINFGRMESITIPIESRDKPILITQFNVRWDWMLNDLKRISERPIIIEFKTNKATLILSYN